jgi:hypothetical protein
MSEIDGYLDLAMLNSEIAEAYLKDAEDELHTTVEKLESCLGLMMSLNRYGAVSCNSDTFITNNSLKFANSSKLEDG